MMGGLPFGGGAFGEYGPLAVIAALAGATALPPSGPPPPPVGFVQTNLSTTTLVGQGTIYGAPGQAPTIVFPNPVRLPRRAVQFEQGPNLQYLLDPPRGDQFTELPPRGPRQLRIDQAGSSLSTTTLVGQGSIYGAPGQAPTVVFPNPARSPRLLQYEQPRNLQILGVQDTAPPGDQLVALPPQGPVPPTQFEQGRNLQPLIDPPRGEQTTDLPPRGPRRLRIDQAKVSLSTTTLVGQDRIYGGPGQAPTIVFPNPPPGFRRLRQYEQGPNLQPLVDPPKGDQLTNLPPVGYLQGRQYEQGPNLQLLLQIPVGDQLTGPAPPGYRRLRQYEQGPNLAQSAPPPEPLPPGKTLTNVAPGSLYRPPLRLPIHLNPLVASPRLHCLQATVQTILSASLVTASDIVAPNPLQIGRLQVATATLLQGSVNTDPNCSCGGS